MELHQRIKLRRTELNMSQEELAFKLGYKSRSSINKIEMGDNDIPQSKILAFANALDTTPSYLLGIDENKETADKRTAIGIKINVLGSVAAGIPIEAVQDIIDTEEISEDMASTGDFFGLKIKGDSMEPRICDGDVVIVRQQDDADSGDIVIAMVNGDDATCKRLIKYATGIGLISLNSKYEPMMFSEDDIIRKPVKIIGKVVELRGKL